MQTIKIDSRNEIIPKNYTGIVEYLFGTKVWFKEGKIHREDGPAKEFAGGHKEWWIDDFELLEQAQILFEECGEVIILEKEIDAETGIEQIKVFTDQGIIEYPIIPGMRNYPLYKEFFEKHRI